MMRSAIALALLAAVPSPAIASDITQMLSGGTTAPVLTPAPQVIPALGGTVATLPPTQTPAPTPPPAQSSLLSPAPVPAPSQVSNGVSSVLGDNAGGGANILQGLLSATNQNSRSSRSTDGWNYNGFGNGGDDSWKHPKVAVSAESREIVRGLVESFMHKQVLLPGEKHCLETSVSELTGDIVGTGKDIITGVKGLMNGGAGQAGFTQQQAAAGQGSVASAGIDGAMKLVQLVTLSTTLVKSCVQGDALLMLKETAQHFVNITYLESRFLVSGVDIISFLAKSVEDYEHQHYHHFGKDIGGALRKILLSNSTTGKALPEGVPEELIIRKTTEGIVRGFFVAGEVLEITDTADPRVDIQLDLHRCIAGNRPFFKEVFLALWNAMAQFSANGAAHGLGAPPTTQTGTPKWTGELMVAMLQLPTALQRCNLGMENSQMLGEAIKTLGNLKFQFHMPNAGRMVSMHTLSDRMAKGVDYWAHWRFRHYGEEIGHMLREFTIMMMPEKYSIDSKGRLRRQLDSTASNLSGKGFTAFALAGVSFAVLVGFIAVRTMRSLRSPASQEYDVEMNDEAGELE